MKYLISLFALVFLFGCLGIQHSYDPASGLMQRVQYDNALFNSSSKRIVYFKCDRGLEETQAIMGEGNCVAEDKDMMGTAGALSGMGAAAVTATGTALGGYYIGRGIERQPSDSVNNNSQSQAQGGGNGNQGHGHGHGHGQ